ncbi:PdaC/SigV domain-containing protein [Paenibacillus dokdonensis]|uniref:PdaC/SigV domain-containing protein n=1 Tax=Paenibacillus dokdonensis TaxID=2567944 RepID=UPI0010A86F8D|nr:DUF4163 domain-containing protein [Paenibacillus dokdonensis]
MNKWMKWSSIMMSAGLLMGGANAVQAAKAPASVKAPALTKAVQRVQVQLIFNDNKLQQKGLLVNGRTMVPITVLRDVMSLPISYDNSTYTYNVGSGASQLNLDTSEYGVLTSVNHFYMGSISTEYNAVNIQGRLYVPFKLLNDVLNYKGEYDAVTRTLKLEKRDTNAIQVMTGTLSQKTKDLETMIQYPQITGLADTQVLQQINEEFKRKADAFAAEGNERSLHRDPKLVPFPYSYNTNYVVTYNQNGILSVLTDQSTYTGGEDPVQREALTFSLKDGRPLSLSDLLPQGSGAEQKLYQILEQRMKKDGNTMILENDRSSLQFYVSGAGLNFYFGNTGPESFVKGIQTYTVGFHELLPADADPLQAFK